MSGRARCAAPLPVMAGLEGEAATAGRIHVMHVVDSLDMGGAERMSVNLANAMPRDRFRVTLCTTRHDGALASEVAPDVARLRLERRGRFDVSALRRLVHYLRTEAVDVIHAHGSSLFLARVAALFAPEARVVWHDHFGRHDVEGRPVWLYRCATTGIHAVVAVNTSLAEWARREVGVPYDRVWHVPNFVVPQTGAVPPPDLPGRPGVRIVCVANLRPQKDHLTLLEAMTGVVEALPDVHLLIVGAAPDAAHLGEVRRRIAARRLHDHVSLLGPRLDVAQVLAAADVGVLASSSEGLPLALIEYGHAGLATVATDVGECRAVLDDGNAGVLVPPGDSQALAAALVRLLTSPALRGALGAALASHVAAAYGEGRAVDRMHEVYGATRRRG